MSRPVSPTWHACPNSFPEVALTAVAVDVALDSSDDSPSSAIPAVTCSFMSAPRIGKLGSLVGAVGARVIYLLVRLFGRAHRRVAVPWLDGPIGGARIGDAAYAEVAAAEGLTVERHAHDVGLVPRFEQLRGDSFDPSAVHPLVREFYERTDTFAMDVWSQRFFPLSLGVYLLVKTISRQVDQLNFPLAPLDTAHGMASEIIALRRGDGTVRYTGWFRT